MPVQSGDILLYRVPDHSVLVEDAIKLGGYLADGAQRHEYFHAAIALDARDKIECNGGPVQVLPIDYGHFDVFRPPIPPPKVRGALFATRKWIGKKYDWVLIADDALRALTHNLVYLPVAWVKSEERRRRICSTLVKAYLDAVPWGNLPPRPIPEDLYILLKYYQVTN